MNFSLMIPEFSVLAVLLVLLVGELFVKDFSKRFSALAAMGGAFFVLASILLSAGNQGTTFGGTFRSDAFSIFFKTFFILAIIPVIQMSVDFFGARLKHPGEFFLILWSSLFGFFFLASAHDFLLLFIALEIVTLSFYIMAAYLKKDLFSIEAGLKYLILGSLSSAFFIYGISLLYFASGSTSFAGVHQFFQAAPGSKMMLLGLIMILAGAGFKAAAAPFQLWVADVYEGAPAPVVSFLSVASKAAGFVIALKVLFLVFPAFDVGRTILFSVLAALTLVYGNLGAVLQTNVKRLFGYSSISHAGYLLMGLAAGSIRGTESLIFYLMAYGVSNLAAFMAITIAGQALGSDRIDAYRGLAKRSPFLAGVLFLSLFSLAGIPPLAGFFGKFLILLSAMEKDLTALTLLAALAVAVSLFYYLNIVRKMYAEESFVETPIQISRTSQLMMAALSAGIIILGLWQAPFLGFAHQAVSTLF